MKAFSQVRWGSIAVATDRLSFLDRLYVSIALAGILVWAFPHMAWAQTVQEVPMAFEITNNVTAVAPAAAPGDDLGTALAVDVSALLQDPRVAKLRDYLVSKNSPMADEAPVLLQQYHYRLILGISFAESNFCRHQITANNCWGIGGTHPVAYQSLEQGIVSVNQLIQKYRDLGMSTPRLMRDTWVGENIGDPNWTLAVTQITQEMESQGL